MLLSNEDNDGSKKLSSGTNDDKEIFIVQFIGSLVAMKLIFSKDSLPDKDSTIYKNSVSLINSIESELDEIPKQFKNVMNKGLRIPILVRFDEAWEQLVIVKGIFDMGKE